MRNLQENSRWSSPYCHIQIVRVHAQSRNFHFLWSFKTMGLQNTGLMFLI